MFRKLAVVLLALAPLTALSQENQPENKITGEWLAKAVMCNEQHVVIETMERFGEKPWIYMDGGSVQPPSFVLARFVFAINPTTQTWSIIEFYAGAEGVPMACLLGFGKGTINMNKLEQMKINKKPKGIDL